MPFNIFFQKACERGTEECIQTPQCLTPMEGSEDESEEFKQPRTCGNNRLCCPNEFNLKTVNPSNCGLRHTAGLANFGNAPSGTAQFAEFPSIASISDRNGRMCTGSLVDSRAVVTLKSCVYGLDNNSLRVRAGSWKISPQLGLRTEQVRRVSKVVFNNQPDGAIALLVLDSDFELNMYVGPVCLASSLDNLNTTGCIVAGWRDQDSFTSNIMVQDVRLSDCPANAPLRRCATPNVQNIGAGSALMCRINHGDYSHYQQVGLQLSSQGATTSSYADLNAYKGWIDKNLQLNGMHNRLHSFRTIQGALIGRIFRRIRRRIG